MWNNPIYKKEVKINIRSRRLALTVFFFNLFLAVAALFLYSWVFTPGIAYRRVDVADILFVYTAITCVEFCVLWFLVPSFTIGAISREYEKWTLEILFTTNLSCMQIVCGKLGASLSQLLLLIFSGMPVLALVFSVGGITLSDVLQFQFLLFTTGLFLESIGIYFSCRFKKTAKAAVYTYGSVIFLLLGTIFSVWIIEQIFSYKQGIKMTYLLLVNPAVSYIASLTEQYGYIGEFERILNSLGGASSFVLEHWFSLSIFLQILCSFLILFAAARCLHTNWDTKKYSLKEKK